MLGHALPPALQLTLVVLVSALAGAVNAIAGGGTLLTFPALIGLGIPPVVANATSTVALWPGALGSMWGYRRELVGARAWGISFALPSLVGGLAGALLLLNTPPESFSAAVPWLVLGATLLFMLQRPIMQVVRRRSPVGDRPPSPATAHAGGAETMSPPRLRYLLLQLLIAVYGGYFGAGIGILMLAALGFMGLSNIHRMNGLKNWGGLCINAVAAVTFAISGVVNWPVALGMALGATVGGYAGAGLAQRVPQESVRRAIIVIGLASGVWLAIERI
jgi:uncharacterized membrane protein YfcA